MQFTNVRNILYTFFITSTLMFSQDDVTLSFGTVDEGAGTMEILMDSSQDVYGFQFNLTGVNIISAEAGGIVPGDWMLSASDDLVLAFSLMATYIPAGSGVVVNITYEVTDGDVCLENGVISGAGGSPLNVGYGDCLGGGDDCEGFVTQEDCEDNDCIWEEDSDICHEDDSGPPECVMDCGGCIDEDCEEDEFCEWLVTLPGDVCLEDCDQEVLEEIDEMIGECGDEQVTLSFGTVDEGAGTMEILMDNSEDVYGFQFNVTGVNIISAEAGGIVPGDWMLSASDDLVLGFSLMATYIPAGSGVLVNITFEGTGGDVCIEEGVISGAGGSPLTVGYGGCLEAEPEPSEVNLSFSGYANGVVEVYMSNTVDVAGFQLEIISNDLDNVEIVEVSGGSSEDYFDMVSFSNPDDLNGGRVLGFSVSGSTVPAGSGVLMNVELSFEGGSGTVEFSGVQFSDSDANALTVDIGDPIAVSGGPDMDVTGNWAADSAMVYMDYMGEWMPMESGSACDPFEEDGEMNYFMPNLTLILNDEGDGSWNEFCLDEVYMWDLFWSVSGDQLTLDFQGCNDEDDCPLWFSDLTVVYVDEMHMQLSVVVEFEDDYNPGETQTIMFVIDYSSIDELVEGCTDSYASNYDDSANIPCDDCCEYDEVETHYNVELDDTGDYQLVIFQETISILEPGDEIGVFDANGVVEYCDMDTLCSEPTYGEVLVGAATWTGDQTEVSGVMSIEVPFGGPVLNGAVEDNPVVVKVWKAAEEMEYTATATWSAGDGYFGEMILAISELDLVPPVPPHFEVNLDPTGDYQLVIFQETISILEPGDEIGVFDANGVVEYCDMDTLCSEPIYGEVLVGAATWTGDQMEISGIMSIEVPFGGPVLNGAVEDNPVLVKVWKAAEEMEYSTTATWSAGDGYFGEMILAISELEVVAESDPTVVINEFFFRPIAGYSVPDYVELHNYGEEDIDLSGWTLDGDPLSGTISAGGYFLVAGEDPFFNADGDGLYAGVDIPNSAFADVSLSTSSDEIVLVDGNGAEVDYVAYDNDNGWMVGNDYRGHALELMNPSLDNNDPTSWASAGDDCESDLLYSEDGSDEELVNFGSPIEENCNYDESLEIEDFNIPVDYSFTAAYPNPFNPVTTLNYALPVSGKLNILVFDMQGREIAVLSDGIKQAGNYSLVWDASGLPSGLYFITLQAQGFNATQKVTLIK